MKRLWVFFTASSLLWAACNGVATPELPTPKQVATPSSSPTTPSPETGQPIGTPTPWPIGTWETTIDGMIFDQSKGIDTPIADAAIIYTVVFSYFPELQQQRPNKAFTDTTGEFQLTVVVHDTDSIKIRVEAVGYQTYEDDLAGVDLFGGRKLVVGLIPALISTITP